MFYDEFYKSKLWGKKLTEYFREVYGPKTRFVLILISEYYPVKDWTDFELSIARGEAKEREVEFILPVKLDDTKILGIHEDVMYLDFREEGVDGIVTCLLEKLQHKRDLEGESNPVSYVKILESLSEEEIKNNALNLSEKELLNVVSEILEEYRSISDREELECLSNYDNFLSVALMSYPKPNIREEVYKLIHDAYFSRTVKYSESLYAILKESFKDSTIRKLIIRECYLDYYIDDFCRSRSYAEASNKSDFLLKFNDKLNEEQINRVADCSLSNDQIYYPNKVKAKLKKIFPYHRRNLSEEKIQKLEEKGLL